MFVLLDVPIADKLVDLALFLILGTWGLFAFVVFAWVIAHVDRLTPDALFEKRQPGEKGERDGSNLPSIASLLVALLSLITSTLISVAQLLHH